MILNKLEKNALVYCSIFTENQIDPQEKTPLECSNIRQSIHNQVPLSEKQKSLLNDYLEYFVEEIDNNLLHDSEDSQMLYLMKIGVESLI